MHHRMHLRLRCVLEAEDRRPAPPRLEARRGVAATVEWNGRRFLTRRGSAVLCCRSVIRGRERTLCGGRLRGARACLPCCLWCGRSARRSSAAGVNGGGRSVGHRGRAIFGCQRERRRPRRHIGLISALSVAALLMPDRSPSGAVTSLMHSVAARHRTRQRQRSGAGRDQARSRRRMGRGRLVSDWSSTSTSGTRREVCGDDFESA